MMCELRSEEVEDAAERIRAGQATLADVQTWMGWPVRVHCGPTNEQALRWLLAEVEWLTAHVVQHQTLLVRLWRAGLGDPDVMDDTDLVSMVCQFCGSKDEHEDSCPWLVLREFVGDAAEVQGE